MSKSITAQYDSSLPGEEGVQSSFTSPRVVQTENDPANTKNVDQQGIDRSINILKPVFSTLPMLDKVSRQANILSANVGTDTFGTVSASRRNPKPFIIGFIIPNFPGKNIQSRLSKANISTSNFQQGGSGSNAPGDPYIESGTGPNPVSRKTTAVSADELKKLIVRAIENETFTKPKPHTVDMIFGQIAAENSYRGDGPLVLQNFNPGNLGAGGRTPLPVNYDLNGPLPTPNGDPLSSSVYVGTGFASDGSAYSTYYRNFDTLEQGVKAHVNTLFNRYPETATARNPEEFTKALYPSSINGDTSRDFSEVDMKTYQRAVSVGMKFAPKDPSQETSTSASNGDSRGGSLPDGDNTASEPFVLQDAWKRPMRSFPQEINKSNYQYTKSIFDNLERLRATPPLLMLINPSSFERNYQASVDSGVKARGGHLVHMWLERPMTISCSGVTAGQYTFDLQGEGGLSQHTRVQSISYQNLLSLVYTYKNNGTIFDNDALGSIGVPVMSLSLYIYYDDRVYIGSFDDFSVEDSADKPYQMSYNFKFTVRYEIDVRIPSSNIGVGLGL